MQDRSILQMLLNRDETAIRQMEATYGNRLLRTALNILGNPQDAEEAVSDTYLAVWQTIPPRVPASLAGFAYRTGRNLALKKLRHRQAEKRNSDYDLSLEELSGCIPGRCLEEDYEAMRLGQALDTFLDTLPRDNRILFLRRYWFGDSIRDLASHLGITENAASVRLSRCRNQLKSYLIEEGFDL